MDGLGLGLLAIHLVEFVHLVDLVGELVDLHALLLSLGLAWGLVGAVVEEGADDLTVVLSEDGGGPRIHVVGVTAALADKVATHITAIGERHTELLLWRVSTTGVLEMTPTASQNWISVQLRAAGQPWGTICRGLSSSPLMMMLGESLELSGTRGGM